MSIQTSPQPLQAPPGGAAQTTPPSVPIDDKDTQTLLGQPLFANHVIPAVLNFPAVGSTQAQTGYRIANQRTRSINITNNSPGTVWINPGGAGIVGIGIPVRPFSGKSIPSDCQYVGIAVGAPLFGTINSAIHSILMSLLAMMVPPQDWSLQPTAQPGIGQDAVSAANAAVSIVLPAATNQLIRAVAIVTGYSAAPGAGSKIVVLDGTAEIQRYFVLAGSFSPNLNAGFAGTAGNSMTFTLDAAGIAGVIGVVSIVFQQGGANVI